MTFPDPDAIKGAISSLKDIVSRSQSDNSEGVRMLRQIEATVLDIEVKTSFTKAVSGVSSITSGLFSLFRTLCWCGYSDCHGLSGLSLTQVVRADLL